MKSLRGRGIVEVLVVCFGLLLLLTNVGGRHVEKNGEEEDIVKSDVHWGGFGGGSGGGYGGGHGVGYGKGYIGRHGGGGFGGGGGGIVRRKDVIFFAFRAVNRCPPQLIIAVIFVLQAMIGKSEGESRSYHPYA
eukprot:Gb_05413 [translate_table: standard]